VNQPEATLDADFLARQTRSLTAAAKWLQRVGRNLPIAAGVQIFSHRDEVDVSFMPSVDNLGGRSQRDVAAQIVRVIGGKWDKTTSDDCLYLRSTLPFGQVIIYLDKAETCTRRVVGKRKVERTIPAVAAQPARVVTDTVEDVEWDCGPILGEQVAS
jgi:hypothetical protein